MEIIEHEHEYVSWCKACGKAASEYGCFGCGDCYEFPKQCQICGHELEVSKC